MKALIKRKIAMYGGTVLAVFLLYLLFAGVISYAIRPGKLERNGSNAVPDQAWDQQAKQALPDQVKIISDSRQALTVRMALMRAAEKSIDITYFAIGNSESSTAFLSEAVRAAERGVQVRILLDGKMKTLHTSTMRTLAGHPNIKIARYNPVNLFKPWTLNEVLHDKFIIVDDRYALLGGRNIEPAYFDLNQDPLSNKYDWDVLMHRDRETGATSIIETLQYYSDLLWQNEATKVLRQGRNRVARLDRMHATAERFATNYPEFYQQDMADLTEDMVRPDRLMLLHNPLTSWRKDPWILQDIAQLLTESEESIFIQTPYATASKLLLSAFGQMTDVMDVYFLTNSLASAKNLFAYPNYYFQRQKFLNTGMKIYEFQDKDSIHGKGLMIDDKISIVGSFNLDSRSIYLDTETMLVIDSPEFTQEIIDEHHRIINSSLEVGSDNHYLSSDDVEPESALHTKKLTYFLVYLLFKPFQFFI